MGQASRSQNAVCGTELLISTLDGSWDLVGTLLHQAAIIIFDNQSTVAIQIGTDASTIWRTFPAGEALVLDLRDKKAEASNFGFAQGTSFFAKGSAGANQFSISYIYASEV